MRSADYSEISKLYRPGHADRTYEQKYGIRDWRGGGRSSARETAARVAAGAVARKFLDGRGISVQAFTLALAGVQCRDFDPEEIDRNALYCPDPKPAKRCWLASKELRAAGDSAGGIVEIRAKGCPPGLGEPVFDKLDARLAAAIMSIGAVKGVEIGEGFRAAGMLGSQNNDPITPEGYESNHAGGILGGISTGMDIIIRAAVKPIPSISKPQRTVDSSGKPAQISCKRPSRYFGHSKDRPSPGSNDPAGSGRFYAPSAAGAEIRIEFWKRGGQGFTFEYRSRLRASVRPPLHTKPHSR